jgi:arylformamidase
MEATLKINNSNYTINLQQGYNITIPISNEQQPNAFGAQAFLTQPFTAGSFVGDTNHGSPVNFYNTHINAHGNGTHTECIGHITKEKYFIKDCLQQHWFLAHLISIVPENINTDAVITLEQLAKHKLPQNTSALLVRTLPNTEDKLTKNYTSSNPTYFSHEAIEYLVQIGIEHLVTDLPSVDKEQDGGQLLAHKSFWQVGKAPRLQATITEMVYVASTIPDGVYLLNINVLPWAADAAPSILTMYPLNV